jgi:hypothetical protein
VGVGRVWDCMLCTCVSEEVWDGEGRAQSCLLRIEKARVTDKTYE